MDNNTLSFIKVSKKEVIEFINSAKKRIIFIKPAFLKDEIEAILRLIHQNDINGTIYMETGENAIRHGFGETAALEIINQNINILNICVAEKIRIAILIVDDGALVYMPDLAFIDEEHNELTFPNGFKSNKDVTDDIIKQISSKQNNELTFPSNKDVTDDIIKLNSSKQNINTRIVNAENKVIDNFKYEASSDKNKIINDIGMSIVNLKKNPAIDPIHMKKINFYKNNYKIVKMQICSIRIQDKSINIKPFYYYLPNINERLKSSWSIFTPDDINNLEDTKLFEIELNKIKEFEYKDFLFNVGRFGYIIDANKKAEFIKSINQLKEDYKEYLGKSPSERVKKRFEDNSTLDANKKVNLNKVLENSQKLLKDYLIETCPTLDDIIFQEKIFKDYRNFKHDYQYGNKKDCKIIEEFVEMFISNKLKFIDVDEIISKIDIKLDWYDISDELLYENDDFMKLVNSYNLEFRKNFEGYKE
jgi:hypothetical protein